LTAAQLSDPAFATDQEIQALTIFYLQLQACQITAINEFRQSSLAAIAPILSDGYAKSAAHVELLKERKITWGEVNRSGS
jgi:hypothetical protein